MPDERRHFLYVCVVAVAVVVVVVVVVVATTTALKQQRLQHISNIAIAVDKNWNCGSER